MTDIHPTSNRQQHKRRKTKPAVNMKKKHGGTISVSEKSAKNIHHRISSRRNVEGLVWNPKPWAELTLEEKASNDRILAAFFGREPRTYGVMPQEYELKNEHDICFAE